MPDLIFLMPKRNVALQAPYLFPFYHRFLDRDEWGNVPVLCLSAGNIQEIKLRGLIPSQVQ